MLPWLIAMAADAGDFRRIEQIEAVGRGGRLVLEDWDGDGDRELIRGDVLYQYDVSMADLNLLLSQVCESRDHAWRAKHAFVHRFGQLYSERVENPQDSVTIHRLEGDFNADGTPDVLVAEPGRQDAAGKEERPYLLRLKQDGETLFEDYLYDCWHPSSPRFSHFEEADLDGDGTPEILAWILEYGEHDRLVVYGGPQSKWRAGNAFDVPIHLTEAIQFVRGVRAAEPEANSPIFMGMNRLGDEVIPTGAAEGQRDQAPDIRFEITFKVRDENNPVDLVALRDYFETWANGYIVRRGHEGDRPFLVEHVRHLNFEAVADSLVVTPSFQREVGPIPAGTYDFWVECPVVGKFADQFRWLGTLVTPQREVIISTATPKE